MSSLRSVVDEFAVEDLGRLEDRQLEDDLVEIDLQMTRLGAQRSRRLAVVDQRGFYRDHGYLSTTAGLAARCNISGREATVRLARARTLCFMPATGWRLLMVVLACRRLTGWWRPVGPSRGCSSSTRPGWLRRFSR